MILFSLFFYYAVVAITLVSLPLSRTRLLSKARDYEKSSKFVIHHNARDKAAEDYKKALPPGMAPNEEHLAWLKNQPWSPLVTVSQILSADW